MVAAAWHNAAFGAAVQSKQGLKPLDYYLKENRRQQTIDEMRANMLILAQRANRLHKEKPDG